MDIPEIRALVEACSYKPGWLIQFHRGEQTLTEFGTREWTRPYIQIEVTTESDASLDSTGTGIRTPWKSGKT